MTDITIDTVIASLKARGFLVNTGGFTTLAALTQHAAVAEEAGEIARLLRRAVQRNEEIDTYAIGVEAADLVIAAICLLTVCVGIDAPAYIAAKLAADEQRGWLHSGMNRAEYERTH